MPKVRISKKSSSAPEGWTFLKSQLERLEKWPFPKKTEESLLDTLVIPRRKARYVRYLFHHKKAISRELYEYSMKKHIKEDNLLAKLRQVKGYENLCCLRCSEFSCTKLGFTCPCRERKDKVEEGEVVQCQSCGCNGCSSEERI